MNMYTVDNFVKKLVSCYILENFLFNILFLPKKYKEKKNQTLFF